MVVRNGRDRIAFENLDIKRLSYSDLAAIKEQMKITYRAIQNEMSCRELLPEYDPEIEAFLDGGQKKSEWYNGA